MANLLDLLPGKVKPPRKFARNYNLLSIYVEGFNDGMLGIQAHEWGDEYHKEFGNNSIDAYMTGHDNGVSHQLNLNRNEAAEAE
jgi:hypothetical protein